ncbi:MAG: hypothetical protein ABIR33_16255 [Pyrinomonadaceae bacterium]
MKGLPPVEIFVKGREPYALAAILVRLGRGERDTLEIATGYWSDIAHETTKSGLKRVFVIEDIS